MKTIAQQMESNGVKVLMIVDLDAASGAAIEQQAKKAGVITVDYDRLTPGGGAALYVSFDNVKVGEAQGTALTQCPQVKGQSAVKYVDIDGAPTDNNATLFKQGYDSILSRPPGGRSSPTRPVSGTNHAGRVSTRCSLAPRTSTPSWSPTTPWPARSSLTSSVRASTARWPSPARTPARRACSTS